MDDVWIDVWYGVRMRGGWGEILGRNNIFQCWIIYSKCRVLAKVYSKPKPYAVSRMINV